MTDAICHACGQKVIKSGRICSLCGRTIGKHHKYVFVGGTVQHRNCDHPETYSGKPPESPQRVLDEADQQGA